MDVETLRIILETNAQGTTAALNGVAGQVSKTGSAIQTAANRSRSSWNLLGQTFSSVNSPLGQLGMLLPQIGEHFNEISGKIKGSASSWGASVQKVGGTMVGIGAAATGVGAIFEGVANKEVQAETDLKTAIENTGGSYSDYGEKIDAVAARMDHFGHTGADTKAALASLAMATQDPTKALGYMGVVAEIAAKKHSSLADAANMWVKVIAGKGGRALAQFGIDPKKLVDPTVALTKAEKEDTTATTKLQKAKDALAKFEASLATKRKVTQADLIREKELQLNLTDAQHGAAAAAGDLAHAQQVAAKGLTIADQAQAAIMARARGLAENQAQTFAGHLKFYATKAEDVIAGIGKKVGPAMVSLGPAIAGVGGMLDFMGSRALKAAANAARVGEATKAIGVASEGMAAAEGVASGATDALAASETAADVAGAPLVLTIGAVVAAIAAIGLIVYEVIKHWKGFSKFFKGLWGDILVVLRPVGRFFKAVFEDILGFIKRFWPVIVGVVLGPVGLIVAGIIKFHKQIFAAVTAAWNAVFGFVRTILGAIGSFFKTVWNAIYVVIKAVLGVIHAVIATYLKIWQTIIKAGLTIIHAVFRAVWAAITAVIRGAHAVISGIVSVAERMWHGLGVVVGALGSAFKSAWGRIVTVIRWAWDIIKPIVELITKAIGGVVNVVGKVVGVVGKVAGVAGKVAGVAGKVAGGVGHAVGKALSWLQGGGAVRQGESVVAGEAGPELWVPLSVASHTAPVQLGTAGQRGHPFIIGSDGPVFFVAPEAGEIIPNDELDFAARGRRRHHGAATHHHGATRHAHAHGSSAHHHHGATTHHHPGATKGHAHQKSAPAAAAASIERALASDLTAVSKTALTAAEVEAAVYAALERWQKGGVPKPPPVQQDFYISGQDAPSAARNLGRRLSTLSYLGAMDTPGAHQ